MTTQYQAPTASQLLLMEDVDHLGRKGEIVKVKPGYARNYLLPHKKGIVADRNALRMQTRLQEERAQQAAIDREISEGLASQIHGLTVVSHVKVDPEFHMYGSVGAADIVRVLAENGIQIERRAVKLSKAIRAIGLHTIDLALKEGITCSFKLKVLPEGMDELPVMPEKVLPEKVEVLEGADVVKEEKVEVEQETRSEQE